MVTNTRLNVGAAHGAESLLAHRSIFSSTDHYNQLVARVRNAATTSHPSSANGCLGWVRAAPQAVYLFVAHAYADVRLFWRAFFSMFGSTARTDIDRRVNQIIQFRRALEGCDVNSPANFDMHHYTNLSESTRRVLFNVDRTMIENFRTADVARVERIRQEIFRECARAIYFQRMLTVVNIFYRSYIGSRLPEPRRSPPVGGVTTPPARHTQPSGPTRTEPTRPTASGEIDLNIPGTVAYVQNAIPADIQNKADEIDQLYQRYEALPQANRPAMPDEYIDIISMDIIKIPVFDASHPDVQGDLPALRSALTAGGPPAVAAIDAHRNKRHFLSDVSMEGTIAAGRPRWHGLSTSQGVCPTCRHSERYGIRREYLLIDTELQDKILAFLRTNVPRA